MYKNWAVTFYSEETKKVRVDVYSAGSDGEKLASFIQNQIIGALGTVDRGVKYSKGLYVLKHTDCPAVLVETAFISNAEDEKLLAEKKAEFAHAIARGVSDFYA